MMVSMIEKHDMNDFEMTINKELDRISNENFEIIDIKYSSYPPTESNYSSYSAMIMYK